MKIPVIEDEPRATEDLREGLAESGYAVEVARNGIDGCMRPLTATTTWEAWWSHAGPEQRAAG